MTNIINRSSFLPSMDSFHSSIPLTSTPKRTTTTTKIVRSQPLSSTLSTTKSSHKPNDLSISAITIINKPKLNQKKKHRRHRRSKPIELKYLLYSTKAMRKVDIQTNCPPLKIYVV